MARPFVPRSIDYIKKNSTPEPNSGCILWDRALNKYGYGVTNGPNRATLMAHRVIWSLHYGTIPAGKQINHKCDVRACVNIDHLYMGTQKDNMRDKVKKGRAYAQSLTHCPQGHEYKDDNIIYQKNGSHRRCKTCRLAQKRNYHYLKLEANDQSYLDNRRAYQKKRYAENKDYFKQYYKNRVAKMKSSEIVNEG